VAAGSKIRLRKYQDGRSEEAGDPTKRGRWTIPSREQKV